MRLLCRSSLQVGCIAGDTVVEPNCRALTFFEEYPERGQTMFVHDCRSYRKVPCTRDYPCSLLVIAIDVWLGLLLLMRLPIPPRNRITIIETDIGAISVVGPLHVSATSNAPQARKFDVARRLMVSLVSSQSQMYQAIA